jgi:hypothetical protein
MPANQDLGTAATSTKPSLEFDEGEMRLLSKRKLEGLVKQIDREQKLDPDVEEVSPPVLPLPSPPANVDKDSYSRSWRSWTSSWITSPLPPVKWQSSADRIPSTSRISSSSSSGSGTSASPDTHHTHQTIAILSQWIQVAHLHEKYGDMVGYLAIIIALSAS